MVDLFERLPKRFSRAALLESFPKVLGLKLVAFFSPSADDGVNDPEKSSLILLRQRLAKLLHGADGIRNDHPMWTIRTVYAFCSITVM